MAELDSKNLKTKSSIKKCVKKILKRSKLGIIAYIFWLEKSQILWNKILILFGNGKSRLCTNEEYDYQNLEILVIIKRDFILIIKRNFFSNNYY